MILYKIRANSHRNSRQNIEIRAKTMMLRLQSMQGECAAYRADINREYDSQPSGGRGFPHRQYHYGALIFFIILRSEMNPGEPNPAEQVR